MPDNLILTGFMGSGKDSVGQEISKKTNLSFLSMDDYIVLKEKRTINDIFEKSGEEYFRKIEKQTLKEIKNIKNAVIATGGGVVKDKENRKILSQMGKVVYLFTNLTAVKKRLETDKTRPLIKNRNNIIKIYNDRMKKKLYEFADLKIDTSEITPLLVAEKILKDSKFKTKVKAKGPETHIVKTESKEYPIYIGFDLFRKKNSKINLELKSDKAAIISNPLVGSLYINELEKMLIEKGVIPTICIIPDGEKYKTFDTVKKIFDVLLKEKMDRSASIIALGGGVVGDLAGFVASTLKRGISLIHVPTSLIAQVDSSIGGKTGFDHPLGKNMIGTFYQPDMILIDIKKLLTLPEKEFRNGLSEVIKYGIANDATLFDILEKKEKEVLNRDIKLLEEIVSRCIQIKKEVVEEDEKEEKGKREVLNYGHTIGHIIETLSGYSKYSHGEAVSMGMVKEAELAQKEKLLSKNDFSRIKNLIEKYKLPSSIPENINIDEMKNCVAQDKKVRKGKIRLPVPTAIGKIITREVECKKFL
jgi:shikimate kinase/3-dehydroquinate synthase